MTRQNIFYKDADWEKVPDKPFGLFKVAFRNKKGQEFIWWPEWDDIRFVFLLAFATEWNNLRSLKEWQEVLKCHETAERVKSALLNFVSEKTQKERQRIIDLLQQGDFREASKLLQSGLVEMAEWLKTESRAGNHSGDLLKEG